MRPEDLPLAVLALIAMVVLVPAWLQQMESTNLRPQAAWIMRLGMPSLAILFIASWVRPSIVQPVLGVLVLAGVVALAPQFWTLTGMAAGAVAPGSLSRLAIQLALPAVILAFAASLGWRRVGG